jgi:hypothetical protein
MGIFKQKQRKKKKETVGIGRQEIMSMTSARVPPMALLNHSITATPQTTRRTLAWSYNLVAAAAPGLTEVATIVLNSPYDPDNAIGGTSATGFAKLMAFYSKCYCLGATIKWVGVNGLGAGVLAGALPVNYFLVINTFTTALASSTSLIDDGLSTFKVVGQNPDSFALSLSADMAKFANKPDILDDNAWFCTSAANPSQVVAAHLCMLNNAPVTSAVCYSQVVVLFDCVFTDPIPFT